MMFYDAGTGCFQMDAGETRDQKEVVLKIVMDNFDNVWEFYEACIVRGIAPIENYADPIEPYIPYINIGEELSHKEDCRDE